MSGSRHGEWSKEASVKFGLQEYVVRTRSVAPTGSLEDAARIVAERYGLDRESSRRVDGLAPEEE